MFAVLAALSYWAYESSQLFVLRPGEAGTETYTLLFDTAIIGIPVALLIGIFLGTLNYRKKKDRFINGQVERHDEIFFIQHWTNAIGFVICIISGLVLGTLFIPRSVTSVESIGFAMNMHYVGVLFIFFGAGYYVTKGIATGEIKHMMPRKGDLSKMIAHYKAKIFKNVEAPKEEKFIAAERVVFPLWIIGVSGIVLSGIFKVLAHVWSLPSLLMGVMTFLHGVFAIYCTLLLMGHIFAAAIISWPMLRSMLTGKMSEEYVRKNHQLWYEEIIKEEKKELKKTS